MTEFRATTNIPRHKSRKMALKQAKAVNIRLKNSRKILG